MFAFLLLTAGAGCLKRHGEPKELLTVVGSREGTTTTSSEYEHDDDDDDDDFVGSTPSTDAEEETDLDDPVVTINKTSGDDPYHFEWDAGMGPVNTMYLY